MKNKIEVINKNILTTIKTHEKQKIYSKIQASMERSGDIPPNPFFILRKFRRILQFTGGILLGILVGIFILLFNYIVIVWILHLEI
jgi:hypothetical protein